MVRGCHTVMVAVTVTVIITVIVKEEMGREGRVGDENGRAEV